MKKDDRVIYNYSKLEGKIKEVFGTQKKFADAMGISENCLSLKLSNKQRFTTNQIILAVALLKINHNEVFDYFFTQAVQKLEL